MRSIPRADCQRRLRFNIIFYQWISHWKETVDCAKIYSWWVLYSNNNLFFFYNLCQSGFSRWRVIDGTLSVCIQYVENDFFRDTTTLWIIWLRFRFCNCWRKHHHNYSDLLLRQKIRFPLVPAVEGLLFHCVETCAYRVTIIMPEITQHIQHFYDFKLNSTSLFIRVTFHFHQSLVCMVFGHFWQHCGIQCINV